MLLPDNDPAGIGYTDDVVDCLAKLDPAPVVRPATYREIETALRVFKNTMNPGMLQEIDFDTCEDFLSKIAADRTRSTVDKYRRTLIRVWNLAVARNLVKKNPWAQFRRGKLSKRDRVWYKPPVFAKMLEGAPDDFWKCAAYTAYIAGLRLGELEHLRWEDVDFDGRTVTVRPHKADALVMAWTPKDTDERTIPIDKRGVELLRERRLSCEAVSPYVFVSARRLLHIRALVADSKWPPNRRWLNNHIRTLKTMRDHASVKKGCWHDFRVSAICNWLRAGVNPHEVQRYAGHADLKTTMEHYALIDDEAMERAKVAVDVIGNSIAAG